jgi:hypothetical protein
MSMSTKLRALAAAAALAYTGAASAVGPGNLGPLENTSVLIGTDHFPGLFNDLYQFSISGLGLGSSFVLSIPDLDPAPPVDSNITFSSIAFLDAGFNVLSADIDGSDGWQLISGLPGAGVYYLAVNGTADGALGGSYGGVLGTQVVAAPVPEPETYALMLAGLGVLGFIARRRKQG